MGQDHATIFLEGTQELAPLGVGVFSVCLTSNLPLDIVDFCHIDRSTTVNEGDRTVELYILHSREIEPLRDTFYNRELDRPTESLTLGE